MNILSYLILSYFHRPSLPLPLAPPSRFQGKDRCVCGDVGVTEQYSQLQWGTFTEEVLDSLYNTAPISMHCNQSSARLFPGEWDEQPVPVVTSILEKPRYPCEGGARPTGPPLTPAV
ncbi:Dopamine beta-hydroxylase [Liparis tanakae]|uniref:Dopamine beta-hydroxylase n=1 Tax=Liparis tanakae TaxID=230148 RepID=A0A4Z2HYS6_9TELE|nr:Dopamine beta-hydroxylase [Liparis tanakae]